MKLVLAFLALSIALPAERLIYSVTSASESEQDATIYYVGDNGMERRITTKLPWLKTVELKPGQIFVLSAGLNDSNKKAEITVKVYVNHKLLKEAHSSGPFCNAGAGGIAQN